MKILLNLRLRLEVSFLPQILDTLLGSQMRVTLPFMNRSSKTGCSSCLCEVFVLEKHIFYQNSFIITTACVRVCVCVFVFVLLLLFFCCCCCFFSFFFFFFFLIFVAAVKRAVLAFSIVYIF